MALTKENEQIVAAQELPKGKAAILEMFRTSNPDFRDEPDEDSLWQFAHDRYSDVNGQYKNLSDANSRLSDLVRNDPRLGVVLSMIAGEQPASFPYAIASVYGREPFYLEGEALEEFERGYQDNLRRLAASRSEQDQASRNIEDYKKTLAQYGTDNGLDENQLMALNAGIYQIMDDGLMGIIPAKFIDLVWKGMNYEKDVQEAADTGFVEGKNEKIDAYMSTRRNTSKMPDFGTGAVMSKAPVSNKGRKGSFFDALQEE